MRRAHMAIVAASPAPDFAQTTGRILGRVLDPSGAVVAGVEVHLIDEQTGVSRDTETNDAGDFQLADVPVGTYRIEFAVSGFKTVIRTGVTLELKHWGVSRNASEKSGPVVDLTLPRLFSVFRVSSLCL